MWQIVFALRHRLIPQQEEEDAKRVPVGHARSFGSWPWQKLNLLVYSLTFDVAISESQF